MGVTPGLMGSPTLGFPVLLFPIKQDRDAFYGESQKD